jgi:hypothetical protein
MFQTARLFDAIDMQLESCSLQPFILQPFRKFVFEQRISKCNCNNFLEYFDILKCVLYVVFIICASTHMSLTTIKG